jgi:dipeptidyl-peptidase-2
MNFLRLFTVLSLFLGVAVQAKNDSPAEIWFTSPVDHFNFADNRTFQQRCLVNASAWTPDTSAPIFFYTGNEGPIEEFYDNTGFVFDHAPEFEALVVFCEHRYYGHSLPFGTVNETFTRKNIGYLSIEQALADYAVLIPQIREMYNANKKSMVISFGGSYGGMLTAWFRLKYPDVVDGALAGSAPLAFAVGAKGNPPFFDAVTADVDGADQRCPKLIREAFSLVLSLANAGEKGLQSISERMRLCKPLTADRVTHLILWARNAFTTLGMMDYPYPTNFLCPLPAFPIVSSCQAVLKEKDGDLLSGLADAASLVYNATKPWGEAQTCFDIETEFIECADQTGCGVDYNSWAWDYQVCTEIVLLVSTNNVTDMFPPYAWNMETLTNYCTKRWGVTPNPNWTSTHFGGSPADPASAFRKSASRIIFSNGLLDPWHGGGFLEDVGREEADMPAVILKHGAHHLDLRSKNPKDPETTTIARATEVGYIRKWLKEGPQ